MDMVRRSGCRTVRSKYYFLRYFALSKTPVVPSFDIWAQSLNTADATKATEVVMPPLDVIMVWHAYMLNPWYTFFLGTGFGCTKEHS